MKLLKNKKGYILLSAFCLLANKVNAECPVLSIDDIQEIWNTPSKYDKTHRTTITIADDEYDATVTINKGTLDNVGNAVNNKKMSNNKVCYYALYPLSVSKVDAVGWARLIKR